MSPVAELVTRCTAGFTVTEWVTTATWGFIGVFVAVEMLVLRDADPDPHRRTVRRSEGSTAIGMAAGALLVGAAYGAVFATLWSAVGSFAPTALVDLWHRHPVAAALCAFVAWDFSGWIYHLIGHRTRLGWAAHGPHHSGSEYNASLALRLTWMPWHGLLHHPLLALVGFRFELILGCLAVSNALQALQHSATLPEAPRWLAATVMTPGAHRHHHGPHGATRNLGPVFTIWDRLAGTWYPPETAPTGSSTPVTTRAEPGRGAVGTETAGWVGLIRSTRRRGTTGGARQVPRPRRDRVEGEVLRRPAGMSR